MPTPRTLHATRYVTPLREGGSMPAIVEAEDQGLYVLKFRGAGQGAKALVAEWLGGEIARAAGLLVPEIVFMQLDPELARTEPDPEIQDLIRASDGLNLALDYLPGSVSFDPLVEPPDALLASRIVWLDAFTMNLDRTARNTNMLTWHRQLWLIDHGAAFYFHHGGDDYAARATDPFALVKDHVLLPFASRLAEADELMRATLKPGLLDAIVAQLPDAWLAEPAAGRREAYREFLQQRLHHTATFIGEAERVRSLPV